MNVTKRPTQIAAQCPTPAAPPVCAMPDYDRACPAKLQPRRIGRTFPSFNGTL